MGGTLRKPFSEGPFTILGGAVVVVVVAVVAVVVVDDDDDDVDVDVDVLCHLYSNMVCVALIGRPAPPLVE